MGCVSVVMAMPITMEVSNLQEAIMFSSWKFIRSMGKVMPENVRARIQLE